MSHPERTRVATACSASVSARPAESVSNRAAPASERTSSVRTRTQPRVLVVDDGEEARDLYCECLEFHGIRAESAEDGATGLTKAVSLQPDLIVLDFSMPRMDGGEVLRRLHADERTHAIPVVLVTAVLELVDPRVRGACAAVLEKPCEPDRLVQTIGHVLEAHGHRRLG